MAKDELTKIQRVILEAAARSANLAAWPLPKRLKLSAGSAGLVLKALLAKGLLKQQQAMGTDPIWKEEGGKHVTLVITKAGFAACGIVAGEQASKGSVPANKGVVAGVTNDHPHTPRAGSKLAMLVALLGREEGATVEEMAEATGWKEHSVRGVLSATLQRRFGLVIVSAKVEGARVYKAHGSSPGAS